jgi:hypothetical protein
MKYRSKRVISYLTCRVYLCNNKFFTCTFFIRYTSARIGKYGFVYLYLNVENYKSRILEEPSKNAQ